jgi:hypothetical protein
MNAEGIINSELSLANLKTAFDKHNEAQKAKNGAIGNAVESVYDQWLGSRIKIKDLVTYVIGKLNVSPDLFKQVDVSVRAFIAANPEIYNVVVKGKNSGVARICDIPAPALPAPKKPRAKKADKPAEESVSAAK